MRFVSWCAAALQLALLSMSPHVLSAERSPEKFTMVQDEATTGSNIKRPLVRSDLPINRTWAELTPEQQQIVRSQYTGLPPTDEPPFPLHGLRGIFTSLQKAHNLLHQEGRLVLLVHIDAQGKAQSIKVLESPGPAMTKAGATILMLEDYKPALCAQRPCAMDYLVEIDLTTK